MLFQLICDVHVKQVASCHLMRLLESLDQGKSDVCSDDCLELICDACDESINDEWGAISAHSFLHELA